MRLFIALALGRDQIEAAKDVQAAFRRAGVRGNYTPEENLHLTLAFIGEYSDPDAVLEAMSFSMSHGAWTRSYGEYTLYVELNESALEAGTMAQGNVRAFYNLRNVDQARQESEELFALPFTRYREG